MSFIKALRWATESNVLKSIHTASRDAHAHTHTHARARAHTNTEAPGHDAPSVSNGLSIRIIEHGAQVAAGRSRTEH